MPPQLFLTSFLNHFLAGAVDKVLAVLHITPNYPAAPIPNSVAMELIVFLILLGYFIAVRVSLSVENPGPVQHLAEMTDEFVSGQA